MGLNLVLVLSSYMFLTQIAQGNLDDFDCVDIYKQPAFQHPLLKDHKIQEKFSFDYIKNDRSNENATKGEIYYSLPTDQSCPEGTVAILKQKNGTQNFHTNSREYNGRHFATKEPHILGGIYRGARAGMSVHAVPLRPVVSIRDSQNSNSLIWVENGPHNERNSIQVGWSVYPRIYGDSLTRFTIYHTANGYKTGCHNTLCPGFIITTRYPVIGAVLQTATNNFTYVIEPELQQDRRTGHWALLITGKVIGYWPAKIFKHLIKGASTVRFGGKTFLSEYGYSPPMGNGNQPSYGFENAAYFRRVHVTNSRYNEVAFAGYKQAIFEDSWCFKVSTWDYLNGIDFTYGGPGGRCGYY